jgi:acetoin utilization deacetylase AcuC-like enzyme
MGSHHPECPERIQAINDQLIRSGVDRFLHHLDAPLATEDQLQLVHSSDHVAFVRDRAPESGYYMLDGDTIRNPHPYRASLRAAGAAIAGVDAVMKGEVDNVFCAVRPPGHHAEPNRSMGFCVFDNVAVAARYAQEAYGIQRVAIIDFDVHHGNGTEAAFFNDPSVMMCSFFQHPFYPYSGLDPSDNMVNVPLPATTRGDVVRSIVEERWLPALRNFEPELIIISAGFDAHREDDLGQMGLVEDDYVWITKRLKEIAKDYAQNRIVSCLEGGYNLSALGRSVVAHVKALADL